MEESLEALGYKWRGAFFGPHAITLEGGKLSMGERATTVEIPAGAIVVYDGKRGYEFYVKEDGDEV